MDQPNGSIRPGISLNAGGDQNLDNTVIATGDVHQDNRVHIDKSKRNIRIGIGGALIAILVGGGYFGIRALTDSSAQNAVYESGLRGATDTVAQLKQAEVDKDAGKWCFLASANDSSTCQVLMTNSFGTPNKLTGQLSGVSLGTATGDGNNASVPMLVNGHAIGTVPLTWTGSRWELSSVVYPFAVNNGGLLMSALEATNHCGALLGFTTC